MRLKAFARLIVEYYSFYFCYIEQYFRWDGTSLNDSAVKFLLADHVLAVVHIRNPAVFTHLEPVERVGTLEHPVTA